MVESDTLIDCNACGIRLWPDQDSPYITFLIFNIFPLLSPLYDSYPISALHILKVFPVLFFNKVYIVAFAPCM